mmetsp:Transcript_1427/g.2021  ORF Transcript_1427/g.2021 Transcript_1427/m.2021 type:complete len:126 (-) Transcript_1427:1128-1505(-)
MRNMGIANLSRCLKYTVSPPSMATINDKIKGKTGDFVVEDAAFVVLTTQSCLRINGKGLSKGIPLCRVVCGGVETSIIPLLHRLYSSGLEHLLLLLVLEQHLRYGTLKKLYLGMTTVHHAIVHLS